MSDCALGVIKGKKQQNKVLDYKSVYVAGLLALSV